MALQIPKVSVVVLAYNHEKYLAQALDSVLSQEADFSFEIIVGEDHSPDGTRRIVQEYERRYPTVLRPIYQARNVGLGPNFRACLAACRGEYIALLEGDDYWTSPLKLARQVSWLDQHPEFALCFHPAADLHEDGSRPLAPARAFAKDVFTFEDFLTPVYSIASTGATMLRNVLPAWPDWLFTVKPIDFPLAVLYAELGPAKLLPEVMSVYRIHGGGIWSGSAHHLNVKSFLLMYEQLGRHYAGTRHAPHLRRHLYELYLTTANVYANAGLAAEAAGFVRQALQLGPGGRGRQHWGRLLGAGLRLARSLTRRPPGRPLAVAAAPA